MSPEDEFEEFDKTDAWNRVYQKIRLESAECARLNDYSLQSAKLPQFRSRNRYRDVSPYDHSRVRLERGDIDYINASLVESVEADRAYLLAQGPLPTTSGHFWLMVWEQNSRAVLMLNRIIEKGQIKCHQYFPTGEENGGDDCVTFEDVGLEVKYVCQEEANFYIVRTFELHDLESGEKKDIQQFHYTSWPDFGVPESPAAFLTFLMAVRQSGALERDVGPPVIHCSAGIGRSGTFCLVDTCLLLIENSGDPCSINTLEILLKMRQYRMGLIQTPDQLRFSYLAIMEGTKWVLSKSPDSGQGSLQMEEEVDSVPVDEEDSAESSDLDSPPSTPPPLPPRINCQVSSHRPVSANPITRSPTGQHGNPDYNVHPLRNENGNNTTAAEEIDFHPVGSVHHETHENGEAFQTLCSQDLDEDENNRSHQEIRRRKRDDRIKNTADQIKRMKKRQSEHEKWRVRKQTVQPYIVGFSIAVLVGSYILYRNYWST